MIRIVFLCLALVAVKAADMKEKMKEAQAEFDFIKRTCADKMDIAIDKIEKFQSTNNDVQSLEDMCILQCIFEESGVMKEGRLSRQGADDISEFFYEDDPETLELAKELTRTCEKRVEAAKVSGPCEVAGEIFKCFKKETKRRLQKQYEDYY